MSKIKGLKIKHVYGTYKATDKTNVGYDLSGIVPFNDIDIVEYHMRSRHIPIWLQQKAKKEFSGKEVKTFLKTLEMWIDDAIEEVDHEFSFIGKDIKQMTREELQDLALYKDLRAIPLYHKSSVRSMRERAYKAYKKHIDDKFDDKYFDYATAEPLIVEGEPNRSKHEAVSNDALLDIREKIINTPQTMDALKQYADKLGIKYANTIGYDKLKDRILASCDG